MRAGLREKHPSWGPPEASRVSTEPTLPEPGSGGGGLRAPHLCTAAAGQAPARSSSLGGRKLPTWAERKLGKETPPTSVSSSRSSTAAAHWLPPSRNRRAAPPTAEKGARGAGRGGWRGNGGKKGKPCHLFSLRLNIFLLLSLVINDVALTPPLHYSYFTPSSSRVSDHFRSAV